MATMQKLPVEAEEELASLRARVAELEVAMYELESKADLMSVQHDTLAHNTRVQLKQVFDAIRELMTPPDIPPKRSIGFVAPEEKPTRPKAVRKR